MKNSILLIRQLCSEKKNKTFAISVPNTTRQFYKGLGMYQYILTDTHYQYTIKWYPRHNAMRL